MKKNNKQKDKRPFKDKHPKLNTFFGFIILLALVALAIGVIIGLGNLFINVVAKSINFLSQLASKIDAVIVVGLITATVSLVSIIFSTVVAKIIDYKKSRQEYLAQKREKPYGEFVDMVYKMQQSLISRKEYTEAEMISDISKFSKEITLWGSEKVVKKWIEFRQNSYNANAGEKNLFVMEEIMNQMRKDMGLKKAKKGQLLGFFINDIKNFVNK